MSTLHYLAPFKATILELRQRRQPGTMHNYSFTAIARELFRQGVRPVASSFAEEKMQIRALAASVNNLVTKLDEGRLPKSSTWNGGVWTAEDQAREFETERGK